MFGHFRALLISFEPNSVQKGCRILVGDGRAVLGVHLGKDGRGVRGSRFVGLC